MIWFLLFFQEPSDLESLAWLAGCWRLDTQNGYVEETWLPAENGIMLGTSRTVKGGVETGSESMRIENQAGTWVFIADPSGQSLTTFKRVSADGDRWVFENLEHDFPQRLIYERGPGNQLQAAIEGPNGGDWLKIPFHYQRIECP